MANEEAAHSKSNELEAENAALQEKVVRAHSEKMKLEDELVIFRESNAALMRQLDFLSHQESPSGFETAPEHAADIAKSQQMALSEPGLSKPKAAATVKVAKIAAAAAAAAGTNVIVPLHQGDLVHLRQHNETQRGIVLGDICLRTVEIQPEDPDSSQPEGSLRLADGLFRLCPHFNYRSKSEVSKIKKVIRFSDNPEVTRKELNLDYEEKRMAVEAQQNDEQLDRLLRCGPGEPPQEPVRFGDVVQLQHVSTGLFLAVHKTPAQKDPNCRKVSLKLGSLAAHLKILPKYKVRVIGSQVHSDDEIVFQSVKQESIYIGASTASTMGIVDSDLDENGDNAATAIHLRIPAVLRQEANMEVNGSMEKSSFSVKLYHRSTRHNYGSLLTAQHWFRFFHTEGNAFMQASANSDKGQVMDAFGTIDDPLEVTRVGGIPAHVPYLKPIASSAEASSPLDQSAKGVWSFEPIDRTTCAEVKWRSPLRIRHVPSGKFLSVDSKENAQIVTQNPRDGMSSMDNSQTSMDNSRSSQSELDSSRTSNISNRATADYYDVALVEDADPSMPDGKFGSPSSLVFYLTPTDVTGATLKHVTSSLRIEHHCLDSSGSTQVLNLVSVREPKPLLNSFLGGSGAVASQASVAALTGAQGADLGKQRGERLCFTTGSSSLHVFQLQPLNRKDAFGISKLLSYVPLFKKYSLEYHKGAAPGGRGPPLHLCDDVAWQSIDLLHDLRKGASAPQLRGKASAAGLKELAMLNPEALAHNFAGEADQFMQKSAFELKLLHAVFEAAQAPYNYAKQALPGGLPFRQPPGNGKPSFVQKILNVSTQRILFENLMAQNHFSSRHLRTWGKPAGSREVTSFSLDDGGLSTFSIDNASFDVLDSASGSRSILANSDVGGPEVNPGLGARRWETWLNIIMMQGSMETLGMLLNSSASNVKKIVNVDFMEHFKAVLRSGGPDSRVIKLLASICTVENRPSRVNQEMIQRAIFTNTDDEHAFSVNFLEMDLPYTSLPNLGPINQPNGVPSPWPRERIPKNPPLAYLGCHEENWYKPVCVAWTGVDDWKPDSGSLWFSPVSMLVGTPAQTRQVEGAIIQFVPVESLMWVVEPERLCEPCTGEPWVPFPQRSHSLGLAGNSFSEASFQNMDRRQELFEKQLKLANYAIAQVELLSQMCRGRSYDVISWLEKKFSYDLLINLVTNPHLPYKLLSASLNFIQALYLDRFPQTAISGAASLPSKLWVFSDATVDKRHLTIPVIHNCGLKDEAAFPAFKLSPASSAFGNANPALSHPDHFKFFLLRSHCNNVIESFGGSGRVVHKLQSLNELAMAALRCELNLLKFGFQSTYEKIVDLCVPNGKLLDGRSDLEEPGKLFEPPAARFNGTGPSSRVVTKLRREVIRAFADIEDFRVNFQLANFLAKFKEHSEVWAADDSRLSREAKEYLCQSSPSGVYAMSTDSEAMFPGGSGDGAKLNFPVLSAKPDFDEALIDCMMTDDDVLMAGALKLLNSNYHQRGVVLKALSEVMLLEHPLIPIFGSVHVLRTELSELSNLESNFTVWGVKNSVTGSFGDEEFGTVMHIIDKLLMFMHTPYENHDILIGRRGDDSSYMSQSEETSLLQNHESNNIWRLDVANKWSPQLHERSQSLDHRNQDILRSCNLQEVFFEAVAMDPKFAWKGAECTESDKSESERRLGMVKRAFLVCCTAFVTNNRKNQEVMIGRLQDLELLANPEDQSSLEVPDAALRSRKQLSGSKSGGAQQPSLKEKRMPEKNGKKSQSDSFSPLAQSLILELLRGNSSLCEAVPGTLVRLFSKLADTDDDVSTSSAIDLHLNLCKPEKLEVRESQNRVCFDLTSFDQDRGLKKLNLALSDCLMACARKSASVLNDSGGTKLEKYEGTDSSNPHPLLSAARSAARTKMEKPERLVRLVCAVCEGNVATAAQLKRSFEVNIDSVCRSILGHIECSLSRAVDQGQTDALDVQQDASSDPTLSPQAMLHLMSKPKGVGNTLLLLLVELVLLEPLSQDQVTSEHLWGFVQHCTLPLMAGLSRLTTMGENEIKVCTDTIDILERIFISAVRLRADTPMVKKAIAAIAENVELLLDNSPKFVKQAFIARCHALKVDALNKQEFIGLMRELLKASATSDGEAKGEPGPTNEALLPFPPEILQEKLAREFDDLHQNGNGLVDIYEFVRLYSDILTQKHQEAQALTSLLKNATPATEAEIPKHNYRLGLRAVECAERILLISQGNVRNLVAQRFTREGEKWREENKQGKSVKSIFARPASSQIVASTRFVDVQSANRLEGQNAESAASLAKKFEYFKSGVFSNPGIRARMFQTRFSMLTALENGTPGPPADLGRSLFQASNADAGWSRLQGSNKVAPIDTPTSRQSTNKAPIFKSQKRSKTQSTGSTDGVGFGLRKSMSSAANRMSILMRSGGGASIAPQNSMSGAVALSWEDVTKRFVRYMLDHFRSGGSDESSTCALIIETWISHLIMARTWVFDDEGRKLTTADIPKASELRLCVPSNLTEFERAMFHTKQSELNRMGVTEVLATILLGLSHDLGEGSHPDKAIALLNEILNGCNIAVQDTLLLHLKNFDKEGKFKTHIGKRLDLALESIVADRKNGHMKGEDEETIDCEHAISTVRFLQLLCAGHHAPFQNYLRSEPTVSSDIDLISAACNMLISLTESTFIVSNFTFDELDLVAQLLNMLIDSVQGPCTGNQDTVIVKTEIVAALNVVIHAVNPRDIQLTKLDPGHMELKGLSCLLLAACLESREDHATQEKLDQQLEVPMIEKYREELEDEIWSIVSEAKAEQRFPRPDEVDRANVARQFLAAVTSVLTELKKGVATNANGAESVRSASESTVIVKEKRAALVGTVEITWRGKVERTSFPLPLEINYLSEEMKHEFLQEVDLSTSERRMKALVKKTDHFVREIELTYQRAEQSNIYRMLRKHLSAVKVANYAVVVALNVNILLSPASLGRNPAHSFGKLFGGSQSLNSVEIRSILLTAFLSLGFTLGYGAIVANLGVTELPLLIQEIDATIRESTSEAVVAANASPALALRKDGRDFPLLADEGGIPVKRNPLAWLPLAAGLLVSTLFSVLHGFNFKPRFDAYATVFAIVCLPLTLRGLREHVGERPANVRERTFAIMYDCMFRRTFLRVYVVLGTLSFLGFFVNVQFFTLGLLEVVTISANAADIIKALSDPAQSLGLVFYLFSCTALIYACFGMTYFPEALQSPVYDFETNETRREECDSTVSCFLLIFYHGMNRSGNIMNDLISNNPGSNYFQRIVFDSAMFVWVGIVMVNLITALMINTFMSNRQGKQKRQDQLRNNCFVCGTIRSQYESFALSNSAPNFDAHLAEDHSIWTYVHYIAYLSRKDPNDDSGIETYVRAQLKSHFLEWVPTRSSYVLEAEGKTGPNAGVSAANATSRVNTEAQQKNNEVAVENKTSEANVA